MRRGGRKSMPVRGLALPGPPPPLGMRIMHDDGTVWRLARAVLTEFGPSSTWIMECPAQETDIVSVTPFRFNPAKCLRRAAR